MGRAASPIATDFAARNNVQMKMPHALTSNHAVVLNQVVPSESNGRTSASTVLRTASGC